MLNISKGALFYLTNKHCYRYHFKINTSCKIKKHYKNGHVYTTNQPSNNERCSDDLLILTIFS